MIALTLSLVKGVVRVVAAYVSDELDRYITLPQLAARLGMKSSGGLRTQIANGRLKAKRVGSFWLVSEEEADRYEQEVAGKFGPRPKPPANE